MKLNKHIRQSRTPSRLVPDLASSPSHPNGPPRSARDSISATTGISRSKPPPERPCNGANDSRPYVYRPPPASPPFRIPPRICHSFPPAAPDCPARCPPNNGSIPSILCMRLPRRATPPSRKESIGLLRPAVPPPRAPTLGCRASTNIPKNPLRSFPPCNATRSCPALAISVRSSIHSNNGLHLLSKNASRFPSLF